MLTLALTLARRAARPALCPEASRRAQRGLKLKQRGTFIHNRQYSLGWKQLQLLYVSQKPKQSPHLFGRCARGDVSHLDDVSVGVHFHDWLASC